MNSEKTPGRSLPFLPKWLWAIVFVQVILVSFFALATAWEPANFLPGTERLEYVTMLYVTRNLTVVIGLVLAVLWRSHKALLVVLTIRVITDIADAASVFVFHVAEIKSSVPMVIGILILPALIGVGYLWKRIRKGN
ncbi:MAG: hypothetical protein AAGA86_09640 [Bacteroidota bacterium]